MNNNHTFSFPHVSKPISATTCIKRYGVQKSSLHHLMLNNFSFPKEFQDCLKSYYLLYWSGDYLLKKICDGEILTKSNDAPSYLTRYLVIYKDVNPRFIEQNQTSQFKLSFRQAQEEFGLPAYVIVTI